MGTELRRAQCAKQAKRKSNEQRRLASGSAARNRRPRSGWSPEDTGQSGVRRGGTPGRRRRARCEDARRLLRIVGTWESRKRACERRRPEGLKWRAHGAKRSAQSKAAKRLEARGTRPKGGPQCRNTAQASAQGGAKMRNDHAELRGAWARNTPRRKIPFSRAKIASLQFPRPKIRRILAETEGGARRPPPVGRSFAARSARNRRSGSPMSKGDLQAVA